MTDSVQLIAIAEIDPIALTRDRTGFDAEAQTELERSLLDSGLRQPIEVFALATPREGQRFGLLSGYRRFCAFRDLFEKTGRDSFAAIPAFVRENRGLAAALAAMIEENEIRAGISPFERGLICVRARNQGAFGSIEEAVEGLYPSADRQKRLRIRALAHFAEEMDGQFTAPEKLKQDHIIRLARAVNAGFGELIRTALEESSVKDPDHEWELMLPILAEAEEHARNPETSARPGRPRRIVRPRYHLTIRRERMKDGWILRFTGREATGGLIDLVLDDIERMYAP